MKSLNQVVDGINKYVDNEFLNKIEGWQKWIIGSMCGIGISKATNIFNNLKNNKMIEKMEIIDENNNIDIDLIYQELKKQAEKSAITFDVPLIGAVTLNKNDVDKLYQYINES